MCKDEKSSKGYNELLDLFNQISGKTDNMTKTIFRRVLMDSFGSKDYQIGEVLTLLEDRSFIKSKGCPTYKW